MKQTYFTLIFLCPFLTLAQVYDDYFGAGHNLGMHITASGSTTSLDVDAPENSVSGAVDELTLAEASRFLAQASLGYTYEEIEEVRNKGLDIWFQEQADMPITQTFLARFDEVFAEAEQINGREMGLSGVYMMDFPFYGKAVEEDDLLRQRMAFAWSQILVSQQISPMAMRVRGLAAYYDILYNHAFGNFRDMLFDVTMSVSMGAYLSSFLNRKFDPTNGSEPDENFAREIMQLFTIGVHELDINGQEKIDPSTGSPIETYSIEDVSELAKVFTGLGGSKHINGADNNLFYLGLFNVDWTAPMKMFQDRHEEGPKNFLTASIPAGQSGMQDINDAVDYLFNHPNTGPFLAKRLIQHLVKSNPTPAYVARVARVFNNNGSGTRGDLEAVTRAILFDPEARECDYIGDPTSGKLIQPVERFIGLFRAFKVTSPSGRLFINDDREFNDGLLQGFNNSPSVFNFFQFDYSEEKNVGPNNLVSPEFQILNSVSSINHINTVENALKRYPFSNFTAPAPPGKQLLQRNPDDEPFLDFSAELEVYENSGLSGLLDRLNVLLCRGQLTSEMRNIIITTVNENITNADDYEAINVVYDCIYYIMISPDYMIQL